LLFAVADQSQSQPVVRRLGAVVQQHRWTAAVTESQVGFASLSEVSPGQSSTDVLFRKKPPTVRNISEALCPSPRKSWSLLCVRGLVDLFGVAVDVPVGDGDVAAAVQVRVEEDGAETEPGHAGKGEAGPGALLAKDQLAAVDEQDVGFVVEVGDEQGGSAAAVYVASLDAHARDRPAARPVRNR
jgi:hypothetical protein